VGGQGIVLASGVMAQALLAAGFDVKKSEVHGMAQRGGSVTAHLRYGPCVFSPLIEAGTADMLLAFEKIEALRFAHVLRPGGILLASAQEVPPPAVAAGRERYPADAAARLSAVTPRAFVVDALGTALALGDARAANMVMVGAASLFLPAPPEAYEEALEAVLPAAAARVNVRAFSAGRALVPEAARPPAGQAVP